MIPANLHFDFDQEMDTVNYLQPAEALGRSGSRQQAAATK